MADHEQGPEHGALHEPVQGPPEPGAHVVEQDGQARDHAHIQGEVGEGLEGVLVPAGACACNGGQFSAPGINNDDVRSFELRRSLNNE